MMIASMPRNAAAYAILAQGLPWFILPGVALESSATATYLRGAA